MKRKNTSFVMTVAVLAMAMTLMAAERDTPEARSPEATLQAAAAIHAGQVVGQAAGLAYPYVSGATNLTVVGVAQNSAGSNGLVRARSGVFGLAGLGVTAAHIGRTAYAATNDTAWTASPAGDAAIGRILAIQDKLVWVLVGR